SDVIRDHSATTRIGIVMSHEEITQAIEQHSKAVTEFKQKVETEYENLNDRIDRMEEKGVRLNYSASHRAGTAAGIVDTFTKSAQFQSLANGAQSTGRVAIGDIGIKAIT